MAPYKLTKRLFGTSFATRYFADRAQQELEKKVDSLIHNYPNASRKLMTLLSEKKALTDEIISSIKNDLTHVADNMKSLCNIFDSLDEKNISIKDYGLEILKMDKKSIQHLERSINQSAQMGGAFSEKHLERFMENATKQGNTSDDPTQEAPSSQATIQKNKVSANTSDKKYIFRN